jgi:hypothetical protein
MVHVLHMICTGICIFLHIFCILIQFYCICPQSDFSGPPSLTTRKANGIPKIKTHIGKFQA